MVKQVTFQSGDVPFVLDRHAELDFYSANSLKQVSDRYVGHIMIPLCLLCYAGNTIKL